MDRFLYDSFLAALNDGVEYMADKPNETSKSTLNVLCYAACGFKKALEDCVNEEYDQLPDLSKVEIDKLHELILRRKKNIPLSYIIGIQKFMGIDLKVDNRALIPRKETELLGYKALDLLLQMKDTRGQLRVIDVCCGAGNLGLSIAHHHSKAIVYATDITSEAVSLTSENVGYLDLKDRVDIRQGDFLTEFENELFYESIDLIVCNPPYIPSSKVLKMHVEISQNEPAEAFDGGMMGIKIIQKLISESPKFLKKSGWVAFEVGAGQGEFVMQILSRSNKYIEIDSVKDKDDNIRVVFAQK